MSLLDVWGHVDVDVNVPVSEVQYLPGSHPCWGDPEPVRRIRGCDAPGQKEAVLRHLPEWHQIREVCSKCHGGASDHMIGDRGHQRTASGPGTGAWSSPGEHSLFCSSLFEINLDVQGNYKKHQNIWSWWRQKWSSSKPREECDL